MARFPRLCVMLFGGFLALGPAMRPALSQQAFTTTAPAAILMDADTGTILFEKSADNPAIPASTAKLMTAEVVFHEISENRLRLDDEFTVSENAWRTGGALARGSSMFAGLNTRIRVEDLIKGLVIDSGNDAAIILAEGVAGSEQAFASMMTKRAAELGFRHLTFRNAWGKDDPGQRVTPREMALLAAHVIKTYPNFYRYFGEKEFTWNKIRQLNRNPLLTTDIGADGLKTGNIDENSGYCIVASAVQNGQRLILALYGARNAKERAEESRKLLQWGFRAFDSKTLFNAGEIVGAASVFGGARGDVPLVADGPVKLLVPRGTTDRLSARIVYTGPIQAPVEAGAKIARLQVTRGTSDALDIPLKAAESVEVGNLPRRAFDAGLELGIGLFRKYVLKK